MMRFNELKPGQWVPYVNENSAFRGMWVFQHIPKTAGSSITKSLSRHESPYQNVTADRNLPTPVREQYLRLSKNVPLERDGRSLRSMSGHFRRRDIDNLYKRCPSMRVFTFVREPVSRVMSDYRYSRTSSHPYWEKQIRDFPDLDSYIEGCRDVKNKMTFFLEGVREGEPEEIVNSIVSRASYIGLLEDMSLSYKILSALLGMDSTTVDHLRVTETTPDNSENPTAEQIKRIRELNYLDQALFDRVRDTHLSIRDEVVSWERAQRAA